MMLSIGDEVLILASRDHVEMCWGFDRPFFTRMLLPVEVALRRGQR